MFPLSRHTIFLLTFLGLGLLSGCTYHTHIRRGIYTAPANENRIDASVLVVTDSHIPSQVTLAEPDTASLYAFTFDTADGVAVAATDALSTLIARADAGPHTLEPHYDLAADVKLEAGLTRSNCEENFDHLAAHLTGLCIQVTLSLRKATSTEPLSVFSAKRWEAFHTPGVPAAVEWLNKHTLSLLSPVLVPVYTQLKGAALRRQFEQNLQSILHEIIQQAAARQQEWYSLPAAENK